MRFKVDENIGEPGMDLLRAAGHDAASVRDEGLGGERDEVVFDASRAERRALITLDHDFGNVLRFPPETAYGIVVLELLPRPSLASLHRRLEGVPARARGSASRRGAVDRRARPRPGPPA